MGHKMSRDYVMLDSRINVVKARKQSISNHQLQTGEFYCLFSTGPSNHKHELHCSGNCQGSCVDTVGCLSIAFGCHVRRKGINDS